MGLIITSVILTLLTVAGILAYCLYAKHRKIWTLLGLLWLLLIPFGCFTIIGVNTVGIMYNPFKNGIQND